MAKQFSDDDASTADVERAIDIHGAAKLLGLAEITIRQQMARGAGPPYFRVGRAIRFRLGDVLEFRNARTVGKRGQP